MEEIPVAVFAFDPDRRLRLVNRAGERLLARPSERLLGLDAEALGLATCLERRAPPTSPRRFPAAPAAGKCGTRCSARADCRSSCWC